MPQAYDYTVPQVNALGAYKAGQQMRQDEDKQSGLARYLSGALQGNESDINNLALSGNTELLQPLMAHVQGLREQDRKDVEHDANAISTVFRGLDLAKATPQDLDTRRQAVAPLLSEKARAALLSLPPDQIPAAVQRASLMPSALAAAHADEDRNLKNNLTIAQTAKANAEGARAQGAQKDDKFSSPTMIDVRGPDTVGPDGKTMPGAMTTTLAQQNKRTGEWVTADDRRAPLGSPEGVTPPGGSGRFQVQAGRVMAAAEDVLRSVKTINAMPITASTGVFGTANAKTSFLGAPLNYLRQSMSNQQIQTYNALAQGLARSVVTIENQGLAPSEGQIASAAAQLLVQPGDTYLTRLQKQAEFRQHTEAHLEPMLHGTMTTPEQKVYIRKLIADMHSAIPYTVQDIIEYSAKPGQTTFEQFARRTFAGRPRPQATAMPQVRQEYGGPGAPAGAVGPTPPSRALPPNAPPPPPGFVVDQ